MINNQTEIMTIYYEKYFTLINSLLFLTTATVYLIIKTCFYKNAKKIRYVKPLEFTRVNDSGKTRYVDSKKIIDDLKYEIEDYKYVLKTTRECCNEEVETVLSEKEKIMSEFENYKQENSSKFSTLIIQNQELENKIAKIIKKSADIQTELTSQKKINKTLQEEFENYKNIKENEISVLKNIIDRIKRDIELVLDVKQFSLDDCHNIFEVIKKILSYNYHQMNLRKRE